MDRRSLLVSDLDGTLLGSDDALARFSVWADSRREDLRLAYATGRVFDSVVELVRSTDLPAPDFVIGAVGTELREYSTGRPIEGWQESFPQAWSAAPLRDLVARHEQAVLQPEDFQSRYKVSAYLHDATLDQLECLHEEAREEVGEVEMIYSSRRDLDFLPRGANKGAAAGFLARQLSLPVDGVLVSGDSGNDRSLFEHGFRGIVVGNAHEELKALDGPDVYQARGRYADGVLEGLEHWLGQPA